MTWPGHIEIRAYQGGKHGAPVFTGEVMLPPAAVWQVEGDGSAPDATVRFEIRDGRPECVEIVVRSKPDGRGIRTSDMGVFNIDNLITNVFAEVALHVEPTDTPGALHARRPAADTTASWAVRHDVYESRRARRGGPDQAELETVARIYREHIDGAPVQAVASLGGYTIRTAHRRVRQARDAHLLPDTSPGRKKA